MGCLKTGFVLKGEYKLHSYGILYLLLSPYFEILYDYVTAYKILNLLIIS